ncbi:MAG: rRNA maturation RNase YbeY [Flavobacteriales bacterium]|nr:rRNA maturation RNase YbeY [Flavobacteriales bacterium]
MNIIFTSDQKLIEINRQFLNHDFFTDVITFDYNEEDIINGEIYISLDRVQENAKQLQTDPTLELYRIIIHGFLHLCGYQDKTSEEKETMTQKEDYYIPNSKEN